MVLKVAWPHREARGESLGLQVWGWHGAPILHAAEPSVYAVLMERCDPGLALSEAVISPEDGLLAAAGVSREMWVDPPEGHGLEHLNDVCAEWARTVCERQAALQPPFDPALVSLGADLLKSLPASASEHVIVHRDANPTNFLAATRRPWLLVDAEPMVGDPGYDVAPLVLQLASPLDHPHPIQTLRGRYALLAYALGVPFERLVAWSLARAVESALWYAARGDVAAGTEEMATVTVLAKLLGGRPLDGPRTDAAHRGRARTVRGDLRRLRFARPRDLALSASTCSRRRRTPPGPRAGESTPDSTQHRSMMANSFARHRGPPADEGDVMPCLPPSPDLGQLRRQAKQLLQAVQRGDTAALARLHAVSARRDTRFDATPLDWCRHRRDETGPGHGHQQVEQVLAPITPNNR